MTEMPYGGNKPKPYPPASEGALEPNTAYTQADGSLILTDENGHVIDGSPFNPVWHKTWEQ